MDQKVPPRSDSEVHTPTARVSDRKREANRRNAQRSTGPRTPEGKRVSRFNAIKHGLLANVIVVDEGFEDATAFRRLLAGLRAECQPVGILEEIQVEKAAVAYWRTRRAMGYEASQLYKVQDPPKSGESDSVAEQASVIERCRLEADQHGELSAEALDELIENFGEEYEMVTQCVRVTRLVQGAAPQSPKDAALADRETARVALLTILADEAERLDKECRELREGEEAERKAAIAAIRRRPILPDAHTFFAVQRYETASEQAFDRALRELERLQQRRGAERPPIMQPGKSHAVTKRTHRGSGADDQRVTGEPHPE